MEALKWLDGVSEPDGDQRAAVERNSPTGTLYRSHVRARVFGVPSRSVDLSTASKAATPSPSPLPLPNPYSPPRTLLEQVTETSPLFYIAPVSYEFIES